ncbi:MAG: hypothetical protein A3J07_00735 [Candidatus Doudnabacteria bacterium RIFCSPLOWO2_02_FULL_49_13]|uniref:Uncharacterized protein n=1 Tax=Candidatus Doudnabacteria bacterium RIFCSPHIGHO2_12_FULL_48_16 TaxID=1817838 RepID=A0A1F5PK10_9BACT|nr:MAG: hypothetical protein A3B77_03650 [Candidatus Doudnabacteria bacterium RIFCSPHIGHO2_02_FULL_49_24]OGE88530.1 MAG: hypothetical protein A2760_00385 [Candidatus Doudnabacteria bacterium RIFCSPHIGHO2_01_FULL_50_67]OGE90278.1 MAG: hypothetical protein A3E29_04245 [Candidatus Doudnabacteria bacterium RIFCSPHIGHO2_12_FULL_48_16]OGE96934.1 MAG: hypothetical protein A2990_04035 [Candidatus Doudnabacteria bacterium RIFCSPLOWO2_01_FULL_49_40]OGF02334.1 MAG: hypothetical protein A3J07_00735 [Candid
MHHILMVRYVRRDTGWELVEWIVDPKLVHIAVHARLVLGEVVESYEPFILAIRDGLEKDYLDFGSEQIESVEGQIFQLTCRVRARKSRRRQPTDSNGDLNGE